MRVRVLPTFSAATSASLLLLAIAFTGWAQESDQVTVLALMGAHPRTTAFPGAAKLSGAAGINTAGIPGIDSIPNFNGRYTAPGFDPNGVPNHTWYYNMVGLSPDHHGATVLNAPIVPVSLDLRNYDGSPRFLNGQRLFYDATQYVQVVLQSPVFQNYFYSSSERPTQFADAVQRAEFFDAAEDNWHTLLAPAVKTPRVMQLLRGTYRFAVNADGSCCAFVLVDEGTFINLLFPPVFPVDNSTVIGAAELAGDVNTTDLSTFLFPNTYLYANNDPTQCCVLGFHTYDFEPGIPANGNRERRYVMNYSSWISPGLFGPDFVDVTALSHEMSETFNDPFVASDGVHNVTPWWLSPNGNCQDTLEVGDVTEGLPNATYPITMNGFTYHPQNVALLQWFEFQHHSSAIDGAYSYPNTGLLTSLPHPQKVNCK